MKKAGILFVFVMLMGFVPGYAQKQVWNADTIMQRVKRTEQTYFSFQVKMDMTIITKDSVSTRKTSVFSWQKDRMNVTNRDSAGNITQQIIQLMDTVWSYNARPNEVTISYNGMPVAANQGIGMFTASVDWSHGAVIKEIIGDTTAVLWIYPQNPYEVSWNKVEIRIDLKGYQCLGYIKYQKDGGRTICKLEYTSINQVLNPDLFLFDLKNYPAGVKVIDNRNRGGKK